MHMPFWNSKPPAFSQPPLGFDPLVYMFIYERRMVYGALIHHFSNDPVVYNGTDQYYECRKPGLEYQHNGTWYQLKTPFYFWRGTSARANVLRPGETTAIYMNTTPYGHFLKNGNYRVVIAATGADGGVIAVSEFEIS